MEREEELCPDLSVHQEELTLSTLQRTVGVVVRFLCKQTGSFLLGPRALKCLSGQTWNGTVPTCIISEAMTSSTAAPTTMTSNVTTDAVLPGEEGAKSGISTVIIVLWSAGGLLLLTLIILMACILRSHKKGRDTINRSNIFRTRSSRNHPQHGGVNPSFTSYDEIWTWIPVVRDTEDNCPAQINPQERENSANRIDSNLAQTLTPPTYHEAVRETRNQRNRNPTGNTGVYTSAESEHAYDTIPADLSSSATLQVRTVARQQSHQTPGSVPRSSALGQSVQSPMLNRQRQDIPQTSTSRGENSSHSSEKRGNNSGQEGSENRSHANNIRQCAYTFYPQYARSQMNDGNDQRNPIGFTHSEGSMFSYVPTQSGRRIYCDIPPSLWDEDGPPPYNYRNNRNVRQDNAGTAPIMRMEYEYL